jgi:hypothetical protein
MTLTVFSTRGNYLFLKNDMKIHSICAFIQFVLVYGIVCCFLSSCSKNSQPTEPEHVKYTVIGGSMSGSLSADKSPYWVTTNVIVDTNTTLTIAQGSKIYFDDSVSIVVHGKLVCSGSLANPIFLSSKNQYWKGIIITPSPQNSILQCVVVENIDLTVVYDTTRNGSVDISGANVTISNSIFQNNKANNGGAISLFQSSSSITNNIFYNNYAAGFGGALLSGTSSNKIINNTFYKNDGLNYGGAIVLLSPILEEVQNNIFYQNKCGSGDPRISFLQTDSSHYLVQYNFMLLGNATPLFISETNLHLMNSSPCINAGNPSSIYNNVDGTRNDQGAYGGPQGQW